jgi:release factor glutamine methyltransferase
VSLSLSGWLDGQRELTDTDLHFLLRHRLGLDRAGLMLNRDKPLAPELIETLTADAERLRRGEPLAYILGEWSFWDFALRVTPDVLIPRPETETLVEAALGRARLGARVLDLGTGSGALAIALNRAGGFDVLAVDASSEALAIAAGNAEQLDAGITFLKSDWFSAVNGRFDLIVANPPYIAEGDPHLPALRYEPMEALVSGPEGLNDLTHIITGAPEFLSPGGWLLVEHGFDQSDAVAALFAAAGFEAIECAIDPGGQPRVTLGRHGPPADTGRV